MKRTIAAMAVICMGLAAAACAPATVTSSTSQSAGEAGSGKGTVNMVLWPGPEGDAMSKVVAEYNAGQGKSDGISIKMTLLSRQDTYSKESTLMAARSSQQDIYFVATYNVGQYARFLDPLTTVDASNYFPVAVDGLKSDGKQYALPLDVSNHFLLYRKDLVDALLKSPSQRAAYTAIAQKATGKALLPKAPDQWDWTDFEAMSAYFSQSANPDSPTKYGTMLQAKNLLYNTMIWNDVLWGLGGSWTDSSGKADLQTDAAKQAVELYANIYKNQWTSPDASQAEFPETQAALQSGNTAFALQWSAGFADLNNKQKSPKVAGKIAIAPVPGHKTHVHALAIALNKYSTNKSAALKVLQYMASTKAMTTYALAGGIPAMPEVLKAHEDKNPAFAQIATSIAKYGYSEPVFPHTFDAYSKLADSLSGAWVGTTDVDSALKSADSQLQDLLSQTN